MRLGRALRAASRLATLCPPAATLAARRVTTAAAAAMDLTALPPAELLAWYDRTTTFLLDCDGVLWRASERVAGVDATIRALKAAGKRVFYVTNNSTKSRAEYVQKLAWCGIDAAPEEIISSAYAAALYCKAAGLTKKVYVLGQAGLVDELTAVGLTVLGPDDFDKPFAFGTLSPADLDPDVQAVVAGFDGRASYYKIATGVAYLRYGAGCRLFIATNRDATYPDSNMVIAGGGVIVGALEIGAGRAPDVVAGKPSLSLLDIIASADPRGLDRSATVMVGDRLDTDIAFGVSGGLGSTLLVLTGVTHAADVAKLPAGDPHRPSHVLDSFGSLAGMLERAREAVAGGAQQ
jgi:phosphoglycolate/pyridoxal phosphate phosphatase family enzyme